MHHIIENEGRISITVDESTTISVKSVLIINLKCEFKGSSDPTWIFLDLIEIDKPDAESIFNKLMESLLDNGFTKEYLEQNLLGFCRILFLIYVTYIVSSEFWSFF